jgi:hypothetical protein
MADFQEIAGKVVEELPAAVKLLELAVQVYTDWSNGNAEQKEAAQARAEAALGAAGDARHQLDANHADRMKELDQAIKAADHPADIEPPKFDESDVK